MTAAELYEVVKDVPRDAWPRGVDFGPCSDGEVGFSISGGGTIGLLESAFIGSMTAWLAERLDVVETVRRFDSSFMVRTSRKTLVRSSLVAALAAACKEAA